MRSSSSRIKFLFIWVGIFSALYLSRHFIFAFSLETFLKGMIKEKIEYRDRRWEGGNLIYEEAVLGNEIQASQIKLTPAFSLFPPHLSLEVDWIEPHPDFTSHIQLFWDGGPSQAFSYSIQCESASAFHVHLLMKLCNVASPIQLQGGKINGDLQGSSSTVQGSFTGTDLQFATAQGEFDVTGCRATVALVNHQLSLKGEFEGGRFSNGPFNIHSTEGRISYDPNAFLHLYLKGQLVFDQLEQPFICESEREHGIFRFETLEVPFSIFKEERGFTMAAQIRQLPLKWLHALAPFEEGLMSADVTAFFEESRFKSLKLENLFLAHAKLKKLSGDFIPENFIPENFIQGQALLWQEPCEKLEDLKLQGQISGLLPLHPWFQNFTGVRTFPPEGLAGGASAEIQASFELSNKLLSWEGEGVVFSDHLSAQGKIDLSTFQWSTAFESPSLVLFNYTTLFPEGSVAFKGNLDSEKLHLSGTGNNIVFQTETELLHIPGTTPTFHVEWVFQGAPLSAHMFLPPSTLHLKSLEKPIQLEGGALTWQEGLVDIVDLKASWSKVGFKGEFAYRYSPTPHFIFSLRAPNENIMLIGEAGPRFVMLEKAQAGPSKITKPLYLKEEKGGWKLEGSATLDLGSLFDYLCFFETMELPPLVSSMEGVLEVKGWMTKDAASLDLTSNGIRIGDLILPSIDGSVEREKNHFATDSLRVGEVELKGSAIYDQNSWRFPDWVALYKGLHVHGFAALEHPIFSLHAQGEWEGKTAVEARLTWDLNTSEGRDIFLTLQHADFKAILAASHMLYQEGKLESVQLQTTIIHPLLKEPMSAPLQFSWTPERSVFQGPISQGLYENDQLTVKGREIQALYEKKMLHVQTQLQVNDVSIKAKGHFNQGGHGIVRLFERDQELRLTVQNFSEVSSIEGKLFGIDCSLTKTEEGYEGRFTIHTSDPLAALLQQPEWSQIENLELIGLFSPTSFRGTLRGKEAVIKNYTLRQLQATVDYRPTQFDIRQLSIEDPAGQIAIKEWHGIRSHPLKDWEIYIPYVRVQQLYPSLLRKRGVEKKEPHPLQIRQLTLTELTGIIGRPFTFKGQGSLYFTQQEKRETSFLDLPRAFLKEWGLDLALFSPVRGAATFEIRQGKMRFSSLSEAVSEGGHSEFYFVENKPSYIDFNGELFLNLRMKQNVALKLAEPFILAVRGTWEKPVYTIEGLAP